jgi:WD40 repeat protein
LIADSPIEDSPIEDSPITAIVFSPNRDAVLLGSQKGLELRSWPSMLLVGTIDTELTHVHDLKFSPDGRMLLAAGGSPAEEGAVEVMDWANRKRVRSVVLHDDVVYRVDWSPDGMRWVTASGDGICSVVDTASGEAITRYKGHSRAVLGVAFSQDNKTVASAGVDQTLRLWNSSDGMHIRTLDNHVGTVNSIAIAPIAPTADSNFPVTLASISEDRTVRLWQPTIGRLMRFGKLPSVPRTVTWSPAGDRLYVGCNDGRVGIIDSRTMEVIETIDANVGRIHELALDFEKGLMLVAGERGFHATGFQSKQ